MSLPSPTAAPQSLAAYSQSPSRLPSFSRLMDPDELGRAPREDIKKNGLSSPATLQPDEDGNPVLLDGRNRLDALALLGEEITLDNSDIFDTIPTWHRSLCLQGHQQEHPSPPSKGRGAGRPNREAAKADPTKSNRQIAKMAKASHPHVAKVRDGAQKAAYVETVSTSIDTKGRKQPVKRKAAKRKAPPKPESDAESSAAARKAFYLKEEPSAAQPEREAPS